MLPGAGCGPAEGWNLPRREINALKSLKHLNI